MKKKGIITAIAGMALIAGCTKEAQPTPTQAVTFGIDRITSGLMDTKATTAELLEQASPKRYPVLYVESTTDRSFGMEVTVGETVELPIASYRVGNKPAGRWYCYGAEQKTVQEGSFRVSFAQWEEGE